MFRIGRACNEMGALGTVLLACMWCNGVKGGNYVESFTLFFSRARARPRVHAPCYTRCMRIHLHHVGAAEMLRTSHRRQHAHIYTRTHPKLTEQKESLQYDTYHCTPLATLAITIGRHRKTLDDVRLLTHVKCSLLLTNMCVMTISVYSTQGHVHTMPWKHICIHISTFLLH